MHCVYTSFLIKNRFGYASQKELPEARRKTQCSNLIFTSPPLRQTSLYSLNQFRIHCLDQDGFNFVGNPPISDSWVQEELINTTIPRSRLISPPFFFLFVLRCQHMWPGWLLAHRVPADCGKMLHSCYQFRSKCRYVSSFVLLWLSFY